MYFVDFVFGVVYEIDYIDVCIICFFDDFDFLFF